MCREYASCTLLHGTASCLTACVLNRAHGLDGSLYIQVVSQITEIPRAFKPLACRAMQCNCLHAQVHTKPSGLHVTPNPKLWQRTFTNSSCHAEAKVTQIACQLSNRKQRN